MSMVISAASVMRRAYAGNTSFRDENYRKNSTNHDVVSADRKAMMRALDRLEQLDFDSKDEDAKKSVYHTVQSYLDIYNHAVDSARDSDHSDIQRTAKKMKALMKEYDDELEAIGVKIKGDGTVKIDKTKLQKATTRQMSKIFGNHEYTGEMKQLMKKLRNQVNRDTSGHTGPQGMETNEDLLPETVGSNLNLIV